MNYSYFLWNITVIIYYVSVHIIICAFVIWKSYTLDSPPLNNNNPIVLM